MALELLLHMRAERDAARSAAEIARQLRAGEEWARQELDRLVKQGLVGVVGAEGAEGAGVVEGTPGAMYRYVPARPELDAAVERLAALYPEWRVSIIQIILTAPSDPVRNFAEAFRLRKERPDG